MRGEPGRYGRPLPLILRRRVGYVAILRVMVIRGLRIMSCLASLRRL